MIILHKALIVYNKQEVIGYLTKKHGVYHISPNENVSYPVLEETITPCFQQEADIEKEKQDERVSSMIIEKLTTIQKRGNLNEVFSVDETLSETHHKYQVVAKNADTSIEDIPKILAEIQFQKGARKEPTSILGILDSDLLEIVRDRLKGFQRGKYPSEYNEKALKHVELALMYLNRRVEDRLERNVLGTNNK